MTKQRIAILDASHSLFDVPVPGKESPVKSAVVEGFGLQAIPQFKEIVSTVVQEGLAAGKLRKGTVAAVDLGVVCEGDGVGFLISAIHSRVQEKLHS